MNKLIGIAAILTMAMFASGALADSGSTTGTLPVYVGSCGFTVGGPITFSAVTDSSTGELTGPLSVSVTNTGTYPTSGFKVGGTNWCTSGLYWGDGTCNGGISSMPVGKTYVIDDGTECFGSGTTGGCPLPIVTGPGAIFGGNIGLGATVTPYFYVNVPSGTTAGTYYQTITFTGGC